MLIWQTRVRKWNGQPNSPDYSNVNKHEEDLFASVSLEADRQTHAYRSNPVSGSSHPVWNMLLDLPVDDPDSLKDVRVEVFQKSMVRNHVNGIWINWISLTKRLYQGTYNPDHFPSSMFSKLHTLRFLISWQKFE